MHQQIQKVKVESEAAMQAMDKILRSNELTIAMVAALPVTPHPTKPQP